MGNEEQQVVPEGYQLTEVGVIPEDWEVKLINELTSSIGDGIHSTPAYSIMGKYYFINGNNIVNGALNITSDTKKVDFKEFKKHKKNISLRTILLSINGTIGSLALYNNESVVLGKSAAYINIKEKFSKIFVYYGLQSKSTVDFFTDGLTGSTIKNLGLGVIRETPMPIPINIDEQIKISNALSGIDALITSLEKLTTKKRAIKTATMQQLLTGKKRLSPFDKNHTGYQQTELGEVPNDWKIIRLGEALSIKHGKDQKNIEDDNGIYPILATGGEIGRTNTALYSKQSVLIGRKGTINKPVFMDAPFWTVDTLFYSKVYPTHCVKFVYYKFCLVDWMSYSEASGVPSLNASTIENIVQAFPCEESEQVAIAEILSDMDKEIESLQQRLNKTQQIKQGMMQELLTGKTRLI